MKKLGSLLLIIAPTVVQAQRADTILTRDVATGVTHTRLVRNAGPSVVNIVRVDLRNADLNLRHVRANDSLLSRERVSDMVRRNASPAESVLVAINADFFDVNAGGNENNQMIDGEWWRGMRVTDSPFDSFDNIHSQFAFDSLRRPLLERFSLQAVAFSRNATLAVNEINPVKAPAPGATSGLSLFTGRFGPRTPVRDAVAAMELSLIQVARRGDTLVYLRSGPLRSGSGSTIPGGGAVLAAYGAEMRDFMQLASDDTVRVHVAARPEPPFTRRAPLTLIVGGWPRILRAGVNITSASAAEEGTIARNADLRHPRSAVGFSRDSSSLFLVTVDGRSTASVGMTIGELADLMLEAGAWDALNFDGGGSTTMVVRGRIVNTPADPAGERPVGNAILVTRKLRRQS